jgi:hypothetical protein
MGTAIVAVRPQLGTPFVKGGWEWVNGSGNPTPALSLAGEGVQNLKPVQSAPNPDYAGWSGGGGFA